MSDDELKRVCPICEREVPRLTEHHLIPRSLASRKKIKRDNKGSVRTTVDVCVPCQDAIHATFTEKELAEGINTVEAIKTHPEMQGYLKWIRKRPGDMRVHWRRNKRRL